MVLGPGGDVLAEGRNRAYDPPGGDDPLQGNPIADAEMNGLARIAAVLFLAGIRAFSGASAPMLVRARDREPETTGLLATVELQQLRTTLLPDALGPIRPHAADAARRRHQRIRG